MSVSEVWAAAAVLEADGSTPIGTCSDPAARPVVVLRFRADGVHYGCIWHPDADVYEFDCPARLKGRVTAAGDPLHGLAAAALAQLPGGPELTAVNRKLKATWTVEAAQDLQAPVDPAAAQALAAVLAADLARFWQPSGADPILQIETLPIYSSHGPRSRLGDERS